MSAATAQQTEAGRKERPATVKVPHPFIRIFHWTLVLLFALAWISEDLQALHQPVGYAIMLLVAFRTVWGFFGPRQTRFSKLVRSPRASLAYARELLHGRVPRLSSHNPLGALMIVGLLFMLTATGVSGWLMTADAGWSTEWLEEVHEFFASVTLTLAGIHVLAVLIMSAVHGENLIRTMISGRKEP
jgi:cytochrome b